MERTVPSFLAGVFITRQQTRTPCRLSWGHMHSPFILVCYQRHVFVFAVCVQSCADLRGLGKLQIEFKVNPNGYIKIKPGSREALELHATDRIRTKGTRVRAQSRSPTVRARSQSQVLPQTNYAISGSVVWIAHISASSYQR